MDSQQNSGNELLLEALNSHLSGPHKRLSSNSSVDGDICESVPLTVVQNDALLGKTEEAGEGFASSGAKRSHLGDCSAEARPVRFCDERVCITVLLLLRRTKECAGSFEIQPYLCRLMQCFSDYCQCNFKLFLFSRVSPPQLLLGPG